MQNNNAKLILKLNHFYRQNLITIFEIYPPRQQRKLLI